MGFAALFRKRDSSSKLDRDNDSLNTTYSNVTTTATATARTRRPSQITSFFSSTFKSNNASAPTLSQYSSTTTPNHLRQPLNSPSSQHPSSNGSWDDVGVSLSSSSNRPHNPARSNQSQAADEQRRELNKKSSKWLLGLGGGKPKSLSDSIKSSKSRDREMSAGSSYSNSHKRGFEVNSFRAVSRVYEDPVINDPSSFSSFDRSSTSTFSPLPTSPRLPSDRPPTSSRHSTIDIPRSESPTISVEAFRFARDRSSSSLNTLAVSPTEFPERPRFEPSQSNRNSVARDITVAEVLVPPRPRFSATPSDPLRRLSTASLPTLPTSNSNASISSRAKAPTVVPPPINREDRRQRTRSSADLDEALRVVQLYAASQEGHEDEPVPVTEIRRPSSSSITTTTDKIAPPLRPTNKSTSSVSLPPVSAAPSPSPSTLPRIQTRDLESQPTTETPSLRSPTSTITPTTSTKHRQPILSWNDTDSEAEETESDDEDDVPLARLPQTRGSTTDLSLFGQSSRPIANDVEGVRRGSSELEVLTEAAASLSRSTQGNRSAMAERYATALAGSPQLPSSSSPPASSIETMDYTPVPRRPSSRQLERRSLSSFTVNHTDYSSSSSSFAPPSLNGRTYSNPASPHLRATYNNTELPALPPPLVESRASKLVLAQRSSATSSSSDSTGSSLPRTPLDGSPAPSALGMKTGRNGGGKQDVPFDVTSLNNEADQKWLNRRSDVPQSGGRPVSIAQSQVPRSSTSLGFSASGNSSHYAREDPRSRSSSYGNPIAPRNYSASTFSSARREVPSVSASAANRKEAGGDVYNRMKARHKVEALNAIAIGRDLNGDGLLDEDDDDEDDNIPLASFSPRSSRAGSAYGAFPPLSSIGGYSQLSIAPPGVDPALYASLPPDQKMSLHQRANQMMEMMAQASYVAKAQSEAGGSSIGSNQSYHHHRSPQQHQHQPQQSYSNYGYNNNYGGISMPSVRLPFAPSNSSSQQFFSNQNQPHPQYASSAIGYSSTSPNSSNTFSQGGYGRRVAASTIGASSNPRR